MGRTDIMRRGTLIVLSGPSGAGKTSVYRRVLQALPQVRFSVSCTTRAPRAGELDGSDYHFLTPEAFGRRRDAGDFLEHAIVHGNAYGTLRAEVLPHLEAGQDVLLDVDVQGARQIRERLQGNPAGAAAAFVFCLPPSTAALRQRLTARGADAPSTIERRLQNAVAEMAAWREYEWVIVNDQLDDAVAALDAIIRAARHRTCLYAKEPWKT